MIGRKPLFAGEESTEQVELIVQIIGTPKIDDVYKKGRGNLREVVFKFGPLKKMDYKQILPNASSEALDLLDKMLQFDPDVRYTINECLNHKYFKDMDNTITDKPEKASEFDFKFEEDDDIETDELRKLILHEILLYHEDSIYDEYERKKAKFLMEKSVIKTKA